MSFMECFSFCLFVCLIYFILLFFVFIEMKVENWNGETFPEVCTEWGDQATIDTCRTLKKYAKNGG